MQTNQSVPNRDSSFGCGLSADSGSSKWIEFCLHGVIWQAQDSIRRCDRFQAIKNEYRELVTNPSPRTFLIIEGLFHEPIVTAPLLASRLGVSFPTAKADIDKLVEFGVLKEIAHTRPKAYGASEIISASYGEPEELY